MTILSSISSAFGVPNPVNALVSAVQQAGASNPGSSTTAHATGSGAPTSATDALNGTPAPHRHHHHGGSSAPSATDAASAAANGAIGTATTGISATTNPVSTFVSTLNSALATLGASEAGAQAGSGAKTTLYA